MRAAVYFFSPDFWPAFVPDFCSAGLPPPACIFGVPNVTLREVTERPETIDCGSNLLSGTEPASILEHVRLVTSQAAAWRPPAEYTAPLVAEAVLRIVTGFRVPDAAEHDWRRQARG